MISVSGVATVEIPPSFVYGGANRNEVDLLVSINYKSSLQLISNSSILVDTLKELERGYTISFEGMLGSDEPGIIFVKLSAIRIISRRKPRKSRVKDLITNDGE